MISHKTKTVFLMIVVNIAVFFILLLMIEFGFRWFWTGQQEFAGAIYSQQFQPYIMFSTNPREGNVFWRDLFRNETIEGNVHFNNYGFSMYEDLDFAKEYQKEANERLVLITGGSAVHGVGATSNETMIHAQMEKELNELQDTYDYRVVNLGMGGWIAYQEFIGLNLWGKWMEPDWIVVMDGRNDIAVACAHAQGAVNPLHFYHMKSYIDSYLQNQTRPSFYRGWLENQLVRYSYAYRSITGKQYVPNNQYLVHSEGFSRVATQTSWEDIERQLVFYLHAQESIVGLSDEAKYILSLQPLSHTYSETYLKTEEELEKIAAERKSKECGLRVYQEAGVVYFMNKAETGLQEIADRYSNEKIVKTYNVGAILPDRDEARNEFFLDEAHLTDAGQERVGKFYAYQILKEDFPEMEQELEAKLRAFQPFDQIFPSHRGFSIVLYENQYYGLSNSAQIDLTDPAALSQCLADQSCVTGDSVAEIEADIDYLLAVPLGTFAVVLHKGKYYVLAQNLGPETLIDNTLWQACLDHERCAIGNSPEEAQQLVKLLTLELVYEDYKGFNIIAFNYKFYGVHQSSYDLIQNSDMSSLLKSQHLLQECQAEGLCVIGNSLAEAQQLIDLLNN